MHSLPIGPQRIPPTDHRHDWPRPRLTDKILSNFDRFEGLPEEWSAACNRQFGVAFAGVPKVDTYIHITSPSISTPSLTQAWIQLCWNPLPFSNPIHQPTI